MEAHLSKNRDLTNAGRKYAQSAASKKNIGSIPAAQRS
jgi:hypothetical protein